MRDLVIEGDRFQVLYTGPGGFALQHARQQWSALAHGPSPLTLEYCRWVADNKWELGRNVKVEQKAEGAGEGRALPDSQLAVVPHPDGSWEQVGAADVKGGSASGLPALLQERDYLRRELASVTRELSIERIMSIALTAVLLAALIWVASGHYALPVA